MRLFAAIFFVLCSLLTPVAAKADTSCISGVEWGGNSDEKSSPLWSSMVSMNLDQQKGTMEVSLSNITRDDIKFIDSIRVLSGAPEYFGMMVRDQARNVVTYGGHGYVSFNAIRAARSSDDRPRGVPNKTMTLQSGQKISKVAKVADIIQGTQTLWTISPDKLSDFSLRFRLRIYLSEAFVDYVECTSEWFYSGNNSLLQASNPFSENPPKLPTSLQ